MLQPNNEDKNQLKEVDCTTGNMGDKGVNPTPIEIDKPVLFQQFIDKANVAMRLLDEVCKAHLNDEANKVFCFNYDKELKKYVLFIDYVALMKSVK